MALEDDEEMTTVNQHEYENDAAPACKHCGTTRVQVALGYSCVGRTLADGRSPRVSAIDDVDVIHARIGELRSERDAALSSGDDS